MRMTTAFITHTDCLNHVTPEGHPEQVARLASIQKRMADPEFAELLRMDAALGTDAQILLAHPASHIQAVTSAVPKSGSVALDPDTHMSAGSLAAALRGVGAVCQAVDAVMAGQSTNAFCATRPPGHHAEKTTPMGFCLFGNVAIGAKYALDKHALDRVAIIDFDVHHGNGTQDLVWDDASIFFASTHEMPLYPGTGAAHETGAHGNIMNIPLDAHSKGDKLLTALDAEIIPALAAHKPDMVFISAGFDAHRNDPLANLDFETDDFAAATRRICAAAQDLCQGRVVSTLEGGYDLPALSDCVAAHVRTLMEFTNV